MGRQRKHFSASEKVAILRRHFLDDLPISDLSDEYNIHPTLFYKWQKTFFENGGEAFASETKSQIKRLKRDIETMRTKLTVKDGVIAELLEEHIALKKSLGVL